MTIGCLTTLFLAMFGTATVTAIAMAIFQINKKETK
jgi:hypothetical protein